MVYGSAYRAYSRAPDWRSGVSAAAKAAAISAAGYAVNRVFRYGLKKAAMYGRKTIGFGGYGRKKFGVKYGTGYGQLAGKVKAKYGARRYKRRGSKRFRTRNVVRRTYSGVSFQVEKTGSVAAEKCAYLTHSTAAAYDQLKLFVMACMKELMIQNGFVIQSWTDFRSGFLVPNDILQFVIKPLESSTPTTIPYTIVAGDTFMFDVVDKIVSLLTTAFGSGLKADGCYPVSFQGIFQNGDKPTQISLLDTKFSFFIKSALKMQNRTVVAAGDDEVDVNNVPLYGKIYHGPGNGPIGRDSSNAFLLNGDSWKDPAVWNASSQTSYAEPLDAGDLTKVKKYNKIYLNPGQIKTTTVVSKFTIKCQSLWQKFIQYYAGDYEGSVYDLGLFNTVCLERVIAKIGGETGNINIGYEVDCKGWCTLIKSPNKYTMPLKDVL